MDDNEKYRELFFEEADEHLENLNDGVLELENDPGSEETIDSIFRSAHTLKGMAATMGYETMAKLTHRMENIFQHFKNKVVEVNSDSISLIFDCLDSLSEIIESLRSETDFEEAEISSLMKRLKEVENSTEDVVEDEVIKKNKKETICFPTDHLTSVDIQLMNDLENTNYMPFGVSIRLEETCTLKAPRVYLILDKLNQVGEVTFSYPDTETLEKGEFDQDFHLILITDKTQEVVRENILSNSDIETMDVLTPDEIFTKQVEVVAVSESKDVPTQKAPTKKEKNKQAAKHGQQSIKVDLTKLDTFMNLVSELVVYRTRLENISTSDTKHDIKEPLTEVARITSELQDLVLKIRMQQVSVVMNRFPRVVRDLARDLDKDMTLVIEGEDTELDRTVVSELSEPLVHLIRNSADHGIESRERRQELGKPVEGEIKITAFQQGNRVTITVSDDGKGINPEVIKNSAEKKGISTEGLSEKEILHLIFHPGFSTAQEVTNVSGRGVGMDVVQSKISQLGGSIELQSQVDLGSTFTINLPLTLSIIQSLMVKVSGELFALPQGSIEKVVEVSEENISKIHMKEVFMYQDIAIPVIRLQEILELPKNEHPDGNPHLIIVLLGKNYYAFLVDELIGQQEIVIKKLGRELKHLNKFLGATILGNGDITLILDINVICSEGSVKKI
ncbi:chemotaxis protein CheA [Vagococcus hydrophili]|uniref:Chemotaxis protein CheA n=1 Tax=Vagococcus hydrophili TaxID=2714947 RepID=A0A6G8AW89_9ENTE|nr:chemotaxis protein CheA [Vagococcus hydrophili]QIL49328.1 chemotaxis protein CheA [Vagococcus hydrophili]